MSAQRCAHLAKEEQPKASHSAAPAYCNTAFMQWDTGVARSFAPCRRGTLVHAVTHAGVALCAFCQRGRAQGLKYCRASLSQHCLRAVTHCRCTGAALPEAAGVGSAHPSRVRTLPKRNRRSGVAASSCASRKKKGSAPAPSTGSVPSSTHGFASAAAATASSSSSSPPGLHAE